MGNNVHKEFRKKMQQAWEQYVPDEADLHIPNPDLSFLDQEGKDCSIGPKDMDLDFLLPKKKSKFSRFHKIAAVVMLIFLTSSGMALFLNSNMSFGVRSAIQNIKHSINPDEQPTMDDTGIKNLVITSWEKIENGKNIVTAFYMPQYIPKGYVFDRADFTSIEEVDSITYEYKKGEDVLVIFIDINKSEGDLYLYGKPYKSPFSGKNMYLEEEEGLSTVTYVKDEMMYRVSSPLDKEENTRILENIKQVQ